MSKNLRTILIIVGLVLLALTLWYLSTIVFYFVTSAILALVGRPIMNLLSKIRIRNQFLPNWLKALVVLIMYFGVLTGIIAILVPIINKEIQIISSIDVDALIAKNQDILNRIEAFGERFNMKQANVTFFKEQLATYFDFSSIGEIFSSIISSLGSILIAVASIFFITFFLLKDGKILPNIVDSLTPERHVTSILKILNNTRDLLSRYFTGLVIQAIIFSLMAWGGLSIIHIQNALLIGILAGLLNVIPYLGPVIGAAIGIMLGITSNLHLDLETEMIPLILEIAAVFGIAQLMDNLVVSPLISSKSVKAHPLEIFFVVLIAGNVAGILGMVLAVPLYTLLRIIAKEFFQGYKIVQGLTREL